MHPSPVRRAAPRRGLLCFALPFASTSLARTACTRAGACAIPLAALLATGAVHAAELSRLEPVIVTATRTPLAADAVLSDLVVIDAQAIRDAGAATLPELLQARGGAEIASNGGPGQTSGIFLRGTNANHVVLLIDGVRVNSASAGTNAFENIPLAQIERIEIRRGPSSSLYGADAIGGVIQIFTRQGPRTEARLGAGSRGGYEASAGLGRTFGSTAVSVQAGVSGTRAFSATNASNAFSYDPDRDASANRHLALRIDQVLAPGHEFTARWLHSRTTTRFDAGLDVDGNHVDDFARQRLGSVALESRHRLTAGWTSTLRLARGTDVNRSAGQYPSVFRTDQDQATWQNDLAAFGGQLALGAEWRRERVASDTAFTVDRRSIRSVFASHAGAWDAHTLQVSARHDANSQFGARNTGNLAYGYRVSPLWRVSAAAGTAFKAPSFNDLYYASPFFAGNPELRPERSRSTEAAARYDDGSLRAGLSVFHSRVTDLIAIDSSFSTVQNVAQARIRGATLDAGWRSGVLEARAAWTRQSAVDADTGTRLVRRARDHASAGLSAAAGPWRAGVDLVASGARFDAASNDPASRMGGYGLVHVHAAYRIAPDWTLSARLANAADKRYELVRGYNTPDRNLFVALAYRAQ